MLSDRNKMSLEEFWKEDEYCQENNTPEGTGCDSCPGRDRICADNIRNLWGQFNSEKWYVVRKRQSYDVTIMMYGFDRDVLKEHVNGMVAPDEYEVINHGELYRRLTEAV